MLSGFKGDENRTMLKATKLMVDINSGTELDWLKWDKVDKWKGYGAKRPIEVVLY